MYNFNGKIAIITGSSEGIGLSTARMLANEGATVIINGRCKEKLEMAAKIIHQLGRGEVFACLGDITQSVDREEVISATMNKYGRIDILVNNVGGGSDIHKLEAISDSEWQNAMEFNLNHTFACCRDVVPYMRQKRYGRIVNVSSLAGRFKGRLSGPHYAAAKAGMLGLTRHLAWDLAGDGITVNAVAPGFVRTARALKKWDQHSEVEKSLMIQQIPMHRFATPEEIAAAIVFLASTGASYITGVTLDVNGGYFMT